MAKSFALLASICALLVLDGCGSFQTSDFPVMVSLPASGQCFEIKVMSGAEKYYDKDTCDRIKKRAIFLTSESWSMLKRDIQTNCQYAECAQITGAFDGLFLGLDKALEKVPVR